MGRVTHVSRFFGALCAAALSAGLVGAEAADEKTIRLKKAPAEALATAQEARPDVTFDKVTVEVEDGVTTYEFSGETEDGDRVEVDVVADWAVTEIEEEIDVADIPAEVIAAVSVEIEGFEPTGAEKSTRPDGAVVYELEGLNAEGVEVDIEVQADGESVIVLDDETT
ncbi:MAG: PepSY domain-containing protein [Pseudomonadota bacterium]